MARRIGDQRAENRESGGIEGAKLVPIRVVVRELTRPDGSTIRVEVPVYPPFQLEGRAPETVEAHERKAPRKKKAS